MAQLGRPGTNEDNQDAIAIPAASLRARVRQCWVITYPLIVASLSSVVLAVADTVILGWYSTTELATYSLVLPIYVFAMALIVPWGTATQILVARWTGAGDRYRINRILDTGLAFALLVGVGAAALLLAVAPALIHGVAGAEPLPDSVTVLRILALCLPFAAVTAHYRGVFGGLGQTGIAMRVALMVNVMNIPMSYLLVFGLDLGAVGSASGTVLATVFGSVYIVWFGRRRLAGEYTFWRRANLARPREILAPLTKIGWPDATFAATAYGADIVLVAVVAYLGEESLAGYRLMVATITVLWVVVFGTSSGLSILAGQRLGAGDLPGVHAFRRSGAVLMAVLAVVVAAPPLVVPDLYFGLFTGDDAVAAEARSAVYPLVGIVPMMIIGMTLAGVLRAAGDTRSVMYAGVAGQLLVAVPVAWLFAVHLELGLAGLYVGYLGGWTTRTVITYLRYRSGRWAIQS